MPATGAPSATIRAGRSDPVRADHRHAQSLGGGRHSQAAPLWAVCCCRSRGCGSWTQRPARDRQQARYPRHPIRVATASRPAGGHRASAPSRLRDRPPAAETAPQNVVSENTAPATQGAKPCAIRLAKGSVGTGRRQEIKRSVRQTRGASRETTYSSRDGRSPQDRRIIPVMPSRPTVHRPGKVSCAAWTASRVTGLKQSCCDFRHSVALVCR